MPKPSGFTWVEPPLLAASAMPDEPEQLVWLRSQGIDILLSLSEEPPPHRWVDEAGLMLVHVPVPDFDAPTQAQIDKCLSTISRGRETKARSPVAAQLLLPSALPPPLAAG